MKLWLWFKGLGVVAVIISIVGAILFVMASVKSGRATRRADTNQKIIEATAHDRTKKALDQAAKLQIKVDKDIQKAADADKVMHERLDKLGEANESIDTIADRFNSKRLRQ